MRAYSLDLREKIVDAVLGRGMSKEEAARTFGVGISSVKRYATKAQRGEPLEPGKAPGKRPKMDERLRKLLEEDLKERPLVTLRERCELDEMGVHTSLAPLYGYSPKGKRVHLQVPRNRGSNTTLLASITLGGMGETMAVEGSTNQEVFEAYVEHILAPTLEAGQLVTMDNLLSPQTG